MKILLKLYMVWVFIIFTSFMLLFLPFILVPFLFGNRFSWISYHFLWLWSWCFSVFTFIRYEFHGREYFRKGQSYIYVSNHTSFLDLPGIRLLLPGEFRPIAKKELKKIPVFGWIVQSATVVVDRSSGESRKRSMDKMLKILTNGISVLVFAEGTQNRSKELLQPFKDGAFRMAVETQLPILPMVVVGAGKLMPPSTVNLRPGKIRIYVGQEIPSAGKTLDDVAALKKQTFDVMEGMLRQHTHDR